MRSRRTPLNAFLLAPLAAPLGYWLGLLVWGGIVAARRGEQSAPTMHGALHVLGLSLAMGAPVAYATALVGGLPVYLALKRAGWLGRAPLWIAGAALGWIVARLMAPSLRGELFSIPFPPWSGAALGVVVAEVFWRLHPRAGAA